MQKSSEKIKSCLLVFVYMFIFVLLLYVPLQGLNNYINIIIIIVVVYHFLYIIVRYCKEVLPIGLACSPEPDSLASCPSLENLTLTLCSMAYDSQKFITECIRLSSLDYA